MTESRSIWNIFLKFYLFFLVIPQNLKNQYFQKGSK